MDITLSRMNSQVRFGLTAIFFSVLILTLNLDEVHGQNASDLYLRAPDVIPGTLPEMRTTSYWFERMEKPDEVVMTLSQIEQMNRRYHKKMSSLAEFDSTTTQRILRQLRRSPGLVATSPDLESKTSVEIADVVRDIVDKQIQMLRGRPFGNRLGVQYSDSQLDAMEAELGHDRISDEIEMQPGIIVKNSRLRMIPSIRPEYVGLGGVGRSRADLWNLDIVPVGHSVKILHTSNTGSFLFVLSDRGYGWIKSENIAIASESEIADFTTAREFIITIGDRVSIYSDSNSRYRSGWLRMGDRLPLSDGDSSRLIEVPVRQTDGSMTIQQAWLSPDADVSVGYLPYTRRNVVNQAFKLLDNIYDWTGGWFGRNHATVLRDVFSTFGFELPSNGVFLSLFNDKTNVVSSELTEDAKIETILGQEPFITIHTSNGGHNQLYLGGYKGKVIVFDTHGYGYENENGQVLEIRRCVVGTLDLPDYMLRQDLTITEMR